MLGSESGGSDHADADLHPAEQEPKEEPAELEPEAEVQQNGKYRKLY